MISKKVLEGIIENAKNANKVFCKEMNNNMKQKTAVDWLFEQMPFEWSSSRSAFEAQRIAKQTEKENLLKFYKLGRACADCDEKEFEKFFETCYKDTFEQ